LFESLDYFFVCSFIGEVLAEFYELVKHVFLFFLVCLNVSSFVCLTDLALKEEEEALKKRSSSSSRSRARGVF